MCRTSGLPITANIQGQSSSSVAEFLDIAQFGSSEVHSPIFVTKFAGDAVFLSAAAPSKKD